MEIDPKKNQSLPLPESLPKDFQSQRSRESFAANRALIMFGCYRKGEANDPEVYTAAITAILAEYSPDVIQRVTDPRTGLPRTNKFMPNPAEVAEACDQMIKTVRAEKHIEKQGWKWDGERWTKD